MIIFPFFCLFVVVVVVHVVLFALYLPSLIPVIKLLLLLPSLQKGGWRSGHQDKAFVPLVFRNGICLTAARLH